MKKLLLYLIMAVVPGIHQALAQVPPQPVAVQPAYISSTGFELRWHQPAGTGSSADVFYLDVATEGSFTNFVEGLENRELYVFGNELVYRGYTVANLDPGTTYAWRVRSMNGTGYSEYSQTQFITTKAQVTLTSPAAWYHTYATEFEDYITSMDSDDNGTVYFAGSFGNTLNIETFSLNSHGEEDIFFAAMDSDGEILNAFSLGSIAEDYPGLLKVYGDFAYSAMWLEASNVDVDPGAGVVNAGPGFVLAKYNIVEGTLTWAKSFGPLMEPNSIAVGPEGIILAGDFDDVVDFDPGPGLNQRDANGDSDGFIASYTLDGNLEWIDVLSGPGYGEYVSDAVFDGTNLYVTGSPGDDNGLDVDPGAGVTMVSAGSSFVLKLNLTTGAFVWVHEITPYDGYLSEGLIAIDLGSTILVSGSFSGHVDFGNGFLGHAELHPSMANSDSEYMVEFVKTTGAVTSMRVLPAGFDSHISTDFMQNAGNSVLISGGFYGSVDFSFGMGGGERNARGSDEYIEDRFIASYSISTGRLEWVKTYRVDQEVLGEAMHVNADGLYAAGGFDGTVDLNPPAGDMFAMGNKDMYIVKYNLTSPPAAPAAPVASAASDVTGTSFTAHWAAVGGASYYRIDVSEDDFDSYVEGYAGVIVQGATSLMISGLVNSTEYKYQVRTVTADGASANSNIVTVSTTDGALPPPANFHSVLVGNTGFGVEWNHVPDALEYRMDLSTDNFATFVFSEIVSDVTWYPGWNFVDLQPSTEYQVRIRTVSAEGTGANSPPVVVTTLAHPEQVSTNLWVQNFGTASEEFVTAIASDLDGNVYVTGKTAGLALTIGAFTLNPLGNSDIFIAKFNSAGVAQWAKNFGGPDFDEAWHIAADASGVYVSGAFSGTADFDPDGGTTTLVGNGSSPHLDFAYLDDGFMAKYNLSDGSIIWAKSLGNSWPYAGGGKSLYADGESIYATGVFVGTNDFNPDAGTFNLTSAGSNDIFLGRFNRWTGALDWVVGLGSPLSDNGVTITGDQNNLYLAAKHRGPMDLNPGTGTQNVVGPQGTFISQYGKNGVFQWAKSFQPSDQSNGQYFGVYDMALDNEDLYFVGNFYGEVDVDPGAGTHNLVSYGNQAFGVKLSKEGNYKWAGQVYDFSSDAIRPTRVIADAAGIYVVGYSFWNADFDPGAGEANRAARGGDIFVARYNSADGGFQWAKTFGSWGFDFPRSAAHLTNDGLYIGGGFQLTASFDPYQNTVERTSAGSIDGFIAKYESTSPPPPPAPVQLTPDYVSNTGVNMRWEQAEGVISYRADVSTDNFTTYDRQDIPMESYGEGTHWWTWLPLTPNTTYQMRLRGVGPGGLLSPYSNVVTFTTLETPLESSPNLWTKTHGTTGDEEVTGIAVDASGNVYTTGYYYNEDLTIGATTLTNAGDGDVFFAKYAPDGTVQWAKSLSSAMDENGIAITVDATGLYLTGYFWGPSNLDFDPDAGIQLISPQGSVYNAWMAKYNLADGSFVWAKPLNDTWHATGRSIVADGTSVYIAGTFTGTNDFDPGAGSVTRTAVGQDDAYVARYSASDGTLVWVSAFGSTSWDAGYAVLLDGTSVYTTGYNTLTTDLDPGAGTVTAPGGGVYLSKFNTADGSLVWAKPLTGVNYGFDLSKDATDIFLSGTFWGAVDMDPGAGVHMLSALGEGGSGFVAKFDLSTGDYQDAFLMRSSGVFYPRRIFADNAGFYIGGSGDWGIDFQTGMGEVNRHAHWTDVVLARYDTDGDVVWAKTIGNDHDDVLRGSLAIGPDGLYAGGYFGGTVNFDPYVGSVEEISVGRNDAFLAKYSIPVSAPDAPTATAATLVTGSEFTANWDTASGATGYRLDVSTDNTFSIYATPYGYENRPVGQLSHALTGLDPGTTYYYRVRAINEAGESDNSNVITVTTSAATLAAPVANAANTVSATAFMSSWNAVGSATGYQLDVSSDGFNSYVPGYQNRSVTATSEGVIGLVPQKSYKYRVRAVGAGGTSPNSNEVMVTTAVQAPFAPLATAPTAITSTSFNANWNAVGSATGYKLDVSSDNFITFLPDYNGKPLVGTSEPITGLTAGKSYQYRVKATNTGGTSFNSNVVVAITANPPPAPEATSVSSITINSFVANWNPVDGATSYRLDVSADNFVNYVAGYNDKTVVGTSDPVTGLTPSTSYKYRVRAVDAGGTSVNSNVVEATTLALPNPPVATAATSITASGFTANWNSVAGATSYRLDVSSDNFVNYIAGFSNKTVSGNSDAVSGLTPSSAYKYRVRAVDVNGTSLHSNVVDVTTHALPNAPVATSATAISLTAFTANWQIVAGATSYRLDVSSDNFSTYVSGYSNKTVSATSDVVSGLTSATAYKYRVRTVSADGTSVDSNVIDVTTAAVPPAPVAQAASSVHPNGFTANWDAVAGADFYQLDITANNFSSFVPGFNNKPVTGLSDMVTGLEPGLLYKYRVRAFSNANGPSANSVVIDVTTSSLAPPIALTASNVTATSFTASWNPVVGATAYLLFVSTDNFATFVPGFNGVSLNVTSTSVTGLTANTSYSYKVRAFSPSNTSTDSNIIPVTTLLPPPSAPVVLAETNVTTTSFTANWTSSAGATGYRLDVSDNNFANMLPAYNNLSVTGTSFSVTGLDPATAYQYRVRAENAGGVSPNSGVEDVNTALPLPAAPGAVTATNITATSFIANWNSVSGSGTVVYKLDVSSDNFVNFVAGYNDKEVDATFDQVTGLSPSTQYKYRVRAVDAVGTSPNSNIITATTTAKQNQTITFGAISDRTMGDPGFTPPASASSGLAVVLTATTDHTTISASNQVTIVHAGKAKITANQAGNDAFNPAPAVEREFCINPRKPTIEASALNTEEPVLTSSSLSGNQWFKDNEFIDGATASTLHVTQPGVYTVRVTIETCQSVMSDEKPIIVTGDISLLGANRIMLAPNPVEKELLIQMRDTGTKQIAIYSASGTLATTLTSSRDEERVDVSSYAGGLYIVKIVSTSGSYAGQFIKK